MNTPTYGRTVATALATADRLALSEALAAEIPAPLPDGPSVKIYLAEARRAITAAGGRAPSMTMMERYLRTGLWAADPGGRGFRWVAGRSFGVHDEARRDGMSYRQFAAMADDQAATLRARRRARPGAEQVEAAERKTTTDRLLTLMELRGTNPAAYLRYVIDPQERITSLRVILEAFCDTPGDYGLDEVSRRAVLTEIRANLLASLEPSLNRFLSAAG